MTVNNINILSNDDEFDDDIVLTNLPETSAEFTAQMRDYFVLLGPGKQKKGGVGTGAQHNNREPCKWAINKVLRHCGSYSDTEFEIQGTTGDKSWLPYHKASHLRAITDYFEAIGVMGIENLRRMGNEDFSDEDLQVSSGHLAPHLFGAYLSRPSHQRDPRPPRPPQTHHTPRSRSISPPRSQCFVAHSHTCILLEPLNLSLTTITAIGITQRRGMQTVSTADGSRLTREPTFAKNRCCSIDDTLSLIPHTHSLINYQGTGGRQPTHTHADPSHLGINIPNLPKEMLANARTHARRTVWTASLDTI